MSSVTLTKVTKNDLLDLQNQMQRLKERPKWEYQEKDQYFILGAIAGLAYGLLTAGAGGFDEDYYFDSMAFSIVPYTLLGGCIGKFLDISYNYRERTNQERVNFETYEKLQHLTERAIRLIRPS